MKERPILFSGAMVRAIIEGRKTQTRRVVTKQNSTCGSSRFELLDLSKAWSDKGLGGGMYLHAPLLDDDGSAHRIFQRLEICDRLWVRETHRFVDGGENIDYVCDGEVRRVVDNSGWLRPEDCTGKFRPSIFMPRWASRITLEITGIRVERIQDISNSDVLAEGVLSSGNGDGDESPFGAFDANYMVPFVNLWNSINADRGYSFGSNPWVWVVEFKRVGGDA